MTEKSGPSAKTCELVADADKAVGQNADPKSAIVNCRKLELDYEIKLGKNRILTPLEIPDYAELPSGTTKNTEKIDFEITSRKDAADSLLIEVLDGEAVIFSDSNTSALLAKGEHPWQWDGYDSSDILDTRVLKSRNLKVRLTAISGGESKVKELKLKNKAKFDWVDARIDRKAGTAEVTIRPGLSDGGVRDWIVSGNHTIGFTETSPIPGYTPKTYAQLEPLARKGIESYWTRDGSRANGTNPPIQTAKGTFKVTVKAEVNVKPKARTFPLIVKLGEKAGRSSSLKGFEMIYYNPGYWHAEWNKKWDEAKIKNSNPNAAPPSWNWPDYADYAFEEVSAHEFGHLILDEYGRGSEPDYSWTHKGSSHIVPQEPISGTRFPKTGEIDLMKYFDEGKIVPDHLYRTIASEEDVKGLLWLGRVHFND